jgi:hypothetical protein
MKTLQDWLHHDYQMGTVDKRVSKHLNDNVLNEYDGRINKWPGTHLNVLNWCTLDSGYAVGWNESPSRGWAFVIVKSITKKGKSYEC